MMTDSSQSEPGKSRTATPSSAVSSIDSPIKIILITALDTTWRMFTPVLVSVFVGIGIDKWLSIAPIATIICLIVGATLSGLLVAKQLRNVKKISKGRK